VCIAFESSVINSIGIQKHCFTIVCLFNEQKHVSFWQYLSDPPFEIFLRECLDILNDWLLSRLNDDDSLSAELGDVSSLQLRGERPKILTGVWSRFPAAGDGCRLGQSVWHSLSAEL
jgi:hypothetical protein